MDTFKVGDRVLFGRSHGEQTLGEVESIGRTGKLKVKQLEQRGTMRTRPVGTIWTVPPTLCRKVGADTQARDAPPEPARPARPEAEIMRDVVGCYGGLSPENLTCDGEIRGSAVARRAATIRGRLRACFRELGRHVSEDEAFRWHDAHRDTARGAR